MKLPRISVGSIMAGLFVVAIDCVIYRSFRSRPEFLANDLSLIVRATLPMANILALVVASLVRGPVAARASRLGFVVGSCLAMLATMVWLIPALSLVEWGLTSIGLIRWLESSPIREICAVYVILVGLPLLFQAVVGLAGGLIGRKLVARRGDVAGETPTPRWLRLASPVTLVILAAIPAIAVEGSLRWEIDSKLASRLPVGLEAVVDLANPPGGPLPMPKGSPIRRLSGAKVRVESDREPPMIEMVATSKGRREYLRDRRVVRVTFLDGQRAGESTGLPLCLLRPVR